MNQGRVTAKPTLDLDEQQLDEVHDVVKRSFGDQFDETDWAHCLGGTHILIESPCGSVVAHAAVVPRVLTVGDAPFSVGYLEGVIVAPEHRRQGLGVTLMEAVSTLICESYDFGALATTDAGRSLYERTGWTQWRGPLSTHTPDGAIETPNETGSVYVLAGTVTPDIHERLTCDHRPGSPW